ANFEQGFHQVWEMPSEDWVGLGFGVSFLLLVSWLGARRYPSTPTVQSFAARDLLARRVRVLVLMAPWVALLAFCIKSGMVTGARLISPYYPLLAPGLLLGSGQAILTRKRWWRCLAALVVLITFPVLILTPGRPLWPAQTWLAWISAQRPENKLVT